ncbi:MAG TPA: cold-shock protein [Casimicrobiaceae bacterium]|nr:cold-shock protein [Casimicrobiaceae bacterium]
MIGTVKWFSDTKGIGFIIPDSGRRDVFAHFSAIVGAGRKTLRQGQRVSFDVTDQPEGSRVSNIKSLD